MPSEEKQSYIKQIDHLEKEKHDLYKELGKLKDALKRSEEQRKFPKKFFLNSPSLFLQSIDWSSRITDRRIPT